LQSESSRTAIGMGAVGILLSIHIY
jgi:hypothetical protein